MDWDTIIKALISLLIALLSALTPVVGVAIHRRFTAAQITLLGSLADTAVRAVEQVLGSTDQTNAQKYRSAATYLEDLAAKVHINLRPHEIEPLIEAAVHTLHSFSAPIPIAGEVAHLEPSLASASSDLDTLVYAAVDTAIRKAVWQPVIAPTV